MAWRGRWPPWPESPFGGPNLVDAAHLGEAYLATVGDTSDNGLRLPQRVLGRDDFGTFTCT